MEVRKPSEAVSAAPQLSVREIADAARLGFRTLINNRPDGEGGGAQPTSPEMERAATVAGLHYVYLPVVSGSITPEQVQATHKVLIAASKPMLAFCRSGARSAQLFGLAQNLDAEAS